MVEVEVGEFPRIENRAPDACLQLCTEVVENAQNDWEQHHYGHEVDERQHAHQAASAYTPNFPMWREIALQCERKRRREPVALSH